MKPFVGAPSPSSMEQLQQEQVMMILALFETLWFEISVLDASAVSINHRNQKNAGRRSNQEEEPCDMGISTNEESEEQGQRNPERKMLHTILSGKDDVGVEFGEQRGIETWKATLVARLDREKERRKNKSKSMSELEFEELKGFADLGFNFSEAEAADPHLAAVVPGLLRLREGRGTVDDTADAAIFRPYLSEAWDYRRRRTDLENALRSWRLPTAEEGVDLRLHIRTWAHTVASTVR